MQGFQQTDYSGGWQPNHDQKLQQNVQMVFQRYDSNNSGQLEGQEFFMAYKDLALSMGMAPPQSQQEVFQAAQQCDQNRDGRVSPMEMFNLFKQIQGIQQGQMMQGGFGQYRPMGQGQGGW